MTDRYRVGGKQPGNIYQDDKRFAFCIRDEDGPLVVAALNAYGDKSVGPVLCGALDGVTGIKCGLIRYHSMSVDHEGTATPEQAVEAGYPMFVRWPWQNYDRDYAAVSSVTSGGEGQ